MSLILEDVKVQGLIQGRGLLLRKPVRCATTAAITISGTQTIDSIALLIGDRVLVKNQTSTSQNGIYDVAVGTWQRSSDFIVGDNASGCTIYVEQGTINGKQTFMCNNTFGSDIINTSALTFTALITSTNTQTLTNKTLSYDSGTSNYNIFANTTDTTKKATFTSGTVTGGTRTISFPDLDDTLVTVGSTNRLFNKTLQDSSIYFYDNGNSTKKFQFQLSGITTNTTRTLTFPNFSGTLMGTSIFLPGASTFQTISNKTVVSPNIDYINGTLGRNVLDLTSSGDSSNYLKISNASTSSSPTIETVGSSNNIPLQIKSDPTRYVVFDTTTDVAKTQFTSNTGNYVQLQSTYDSGTINLTLPYQLPTSTKQIIKSTGSSGQLVFSPDRITFTLSNTINIVTNSPTVLATTGFPWIQSYYGSGGDLELEDGKVTYLYKADSNAVAANRVMTVELYNVTNSTVLGTDTVNISSVTQTSSRFGFTLPTIDCRLQLRISATGTAGVIKIYGSSLDFNKL